MDHRYRTQPFLLAPALLALASPGHAQSASDFRLQPGAQPRAPGPVDADNPAAPAPIRTAPAAAAPAPSPTPTLVIPPPTTAAPVPAPSTARPASPPAAAGNQGAPASPPAVRAGPSLPTPAASAEPSLAPPGGLPTGLPGAVAPVAPSAAPSTPALAPVAAADAPSGGLVAWWWLVPAALLGVLGAWVALGRRKVPESPDFVRPQARVAESPEPQPVTPAPVHAAAPAAAPSVAPPALAAARVDPLELTLEPVRFSVSLVNATLNYRLVLANRSGAALGPVHVAADMIAAHASLSEEAQLGLDGAGLELRHEVASLAAGETVALTGDLRLPLAAITPIVAGGAALLVPLVRLRVEGAGPTRTTALVVGEPPVNPGGPLRPFRLDQGPRIIGAVSQRPLATAA